MKRVCIITDTLKNHHLLSPLMAALRTDEAVTLTVLSTGRHQTDDIDLNFASVEACGRIEEAFLDISLLPDRAAAASQASTDREQRAFASALKDIDPEIVVLFGNSFSVFSAAVAAFLCDIPVAYIQGETSDSGVRDDAYAAGIAGIASLHFTTTETCRRRAVSLGADPARVFNVGALSAFRLLTLDIPEKEAFCRAAGMNPADEFIFVSMVPDRGEGSGNAKLAQAVAEALEDPKFAAFKLLCESPGQRGFGRMMKRQLDCLGERFPGRLSFLRDESLVPAAISHCRALIGNTDRCVSDAATLRAPVVLVGSRLECADNAGHMIQVPADREKISRALFRAMSPEFKLGLMFLKSPFEKADTPERIASVLRACTVAGASPCIK